MTRTTAWTDADLDTLREMYKAGATFSQIADKLARTRSGIAGKVRRLKLPKRGPNHLAKVCSDNAAKRWADAERKPRLPKSSKPFLFNTKRERRPPMLLRIVTVPDAVPVPLMERTGCCYPTTTERPHLFCNQPTSRGDYCEAHFRVMYPNGKRDAA